MCEMVEPTQAGEHFWIGGSPVFPMFDVVGVGSEGGLVAVWPSSSSVAVGEHVPQDLGGEAPGSAVAER